MRNSPDLRGVRTKEREGLKGSERRRCSWIRSLSNLFRPMVSTASSTSAPDSNKAVIAGSLTVIGRVFFAAAMIANGIQQIVIGDFVRLVPKLPEWIPGQPIWARVVGAILILIGIEIFEEKRTRQAATGLGALLFLCLVFRHLPIAATRPLGGFMWTNPCKILALGAGALLVADLAAMKKGVSVDSRARERRSLLSRVLLAVFLLVCGAQHFVYIDFVNTLIPAYFPAPFFWSYFTGIALLAGGAGLLFTATARLAGGLSGVMIFLWVLLVHLPRALADLHNAGETSSIFEALALSGVAFLVADSVKRPNVGLATAGSTPVSGNLA